MTEGILRAFFGAFFGALGFAMLIHAPRKSWLLSGLIAGLSYLLYWVMTYFGISDNLAVFCGALFGSVSGQICARQAKMIGTVFLISAVPDDGTVGTGTERAGNQPGRSGDHHDCDDRAGCEYGKPGVPTG